jgi:tetratricopeptide (TPR) repeat protein
VPDDFKELTSTQLFDLSKALIDEGYSIENVGKAEKLIAALSELSKQCLGEGKYAAASSYLYKAIALSDLFNRDQKRYPSTTLLRLNLSQIHWRAGRMEAALIAYKQAAGDLMRAASLAAEARQWSESNAWHDVSGRSFPITVQDTLAPDIFRSQSEFFEGLRGDR